MKYLWIAILLVLTSCAPKTELEPVQVNHMDTRIGTGISLSVDYVADDKRTALYLIVDNKLATTIQIWMRVTNRVDFSESMMRDRVYVGNDTHTTKDFRLKKAIAGVTETIVFEVFDEQGEPVMQTEPIINSY